MIQELFALKQPLKDLGELEPGLAGVLSPHLAGDLVSKFVHSQFLENADDYLAKYQNTDHWTSLLKTALQKLPTPLRPSARILDLGSGGGNTVFPLIQIFPDADIVASDLSLPLLKSIQHKAASDGIRRGPYVVQMNAEDIVFEDEQFDAVVGAAILHHLFEPQEALNEVSRVLTRNGTALFFEPFEIGNQILMFALTQLLAFNETQPEEKRLQSCEAEFFRRLITDFALRKNPDKSHPEFLALDDKWTFTRSYFERAARNAGMHLVECYNLYPSATLFSNHLNTYLAVGLSRSFQQLPPWMRQSIEALDESFSPDARNEIFLEGGIILSKAK